MITNRLAKKGLTGILSLRALFSQVARSQGRSPAQRDNLQFSKKRLIDYGQLPHGQIPNALQFSRPTTEHKLSNGINVVTETWLGEQAAITVAVKAGSRQQTLENSSVAQFVARAALKGTSSKSKSDFQSAIAKIGGHIQINVGRQMTHFSIYVSKQDVCEAVALLGDAITNPIFETTQIEAQKQSIHQKASSMDPEQVTLNNLHYTSFRDHAIGQPSTGIKDNVYSINANQVKQFHAKYYVGENIVVSGAGNINAQQFNEAVNNSFGNLRSKVEGDVQNSEQPFFTPSLLFQRDDQLTNSSLGAAFIAPTWNDPDFFAMNYFKRIIGEYRVDKYTGAHLNAAKLQYNSFHQDLGDYPDIIRHKPFYFAYSDVGLFGSFLFGNQIWNRPMILLSQNKMSMYAQTINHTEVYRARNKYWNDLLERNDPSEVSKINSNQSAYLDRLVSRTEIATRISCMDPQYISNVATKWFWDKETSVTAWGPLHNLIIDAHYARQYRRASLGEYSFLRVKFDY